MRFVETVDKINGLPMGFKEVEYLESTGTQYIDTGIAGSSTLKIEMNGQKSGASFGVYFGAGTGNNRIQAIYIDNYNSARIGNVTNTQLGRDTEKFNIVVDTLNKNVIYNGTTYPFVYTSALTTLNIFIFTRNEGGSFADKASAKCWSFKIWDNNALVRDFIPCLDNNGRPCMYDLVGKKAYYNLGTGADFSYGREIHPVEYLESTGTQYINMGIKSSANMSVKAKFNLSNASAKAVFGSYSGSSTDGVGVFFGTAGGNITGKVYCNNTNVAVSPDLTLSRNTNYEIEMSGTTLVINGSTYTSEATASNSYDMLLFARSNNGTVERQISGKIYNLKIWDNGTLARNYIPAIDENNVPFMFDRVTHTAFLNAGTGEFLYGNPVASNKGKIRFTVTQHEKSRLPLGFREVEYLESTGTQWIDTGVYPTQLTEAEYSCAVTGSVSNVDSHLFGSRLSASSEAFDLAYMNIQVNGTEKFRFIHGTTTTQETTTSVTASQLAKPHTYYMSGTSFKIDGSEKMSFTTASFTGTYSLWLFGVNSAGSLHNQVRAQRVYKCKLWNNGVLIRDFIPCLDVAGKPCMYDLAGKKPYYNQGTGADFNYGREIHYVEYLESSGTQYINTGYAANANTIVEYNFNLVEVPSSSAFFGSGTSSTSTDRFQGYYESSLSFSTKLASTTTYSDVTLTAGTKHYSKMGIPLAGYYIDDTFIASATGTPTSLNLYVFARNINGSMQVPIKMKLYDFKISENNSLVRDYIPAIDENNVGFLFDRVTHTAFLNAGTGDFLYGNLLKQNKIRTVLPPPVPLIYKPVEYLESTGEQYIDTGVVFNNSSHTYKWDIGAQAVNTGNNNYNWFCGLFENGAYSAGTYADTSTNYRFYAIGTYYQNGEVITGPLTNGDKYGIIRNVFTITNFAGTLPVILFGRNQSNGVKCEATKKVFYYKIWDNDTLIRDFIPVIRRSDEKPGFYCKVTKQFFTNAGTGEFLYG